MRIEVGYGLEGVLTDVTSRRIIAEDVAPRFRAGPVRGRASTPASTGSSRSSATASRSPARPPREARAAAAAASTSARCSSCCSSSCRSSAAILRASSARAVGSTVGGGHRRRRRVVPRRLAADRAASPAWSRFFVMLLFGVGGGLGAPRRRVAARPAAGAAEASAAAAADSAAAAVLAAAAAASAAAARRADGDAWTRRPHRLRRHLVTDHGAVRARVPDAALARDRARDRGRRATPSRAAALRGRGRAAARAACCASITPRERALEVFGLLRVWDTEENCGVLVYLLLADRDVEIVADRGIHRAVGDARVAGDLRARWKRRSRAGRFGDGVRRTASTRSSALLARALPARRRAAATSCRTSRSLL